MVSRSVVFPEPFGPTIATCSARSSAKVAARRRRLSTETSRSSASTTVRPLRAGLRNSKPRRRPLRVRSWISSCAFACSFSSRAMWVSFACALRAIFGLDARKRSTKRSRRAMSRPTRSAAFDAAWSRAAFSRRHSCQGPAKYVERPASSSRTAVVVASRNQRSCATRMTAASIDWSVSSSHSMLLTSRWLVGSSSRSRSGSPPRARASEARVSSPPENVSSSRSRS